MKVSKIDELVREKETFIIKKQRLEDRLQEENSKIETRIKTLENKAYRKKVGTDTLLASIDRALNKIDKLIELEKEYVCSLFDGENEGK